jgi:ADP-ribosyltransferase exoenzyme/Phage Mu protein F like protein
VTWGAHKADGRIAANNSVKIRAALRSSINARALYDEYQLTHPFVSDSISQDRARARAWALIHAKVDPEPVRKVLHKVYADGYALGETSASEALYRAQLEAQKMLTKADAYVDWANWKPGHRAASLLLSPPEAFRNLLDKAGIVSNSIAKAGYDRIGTALADSIAAGFSSARAAKVITEKIGDPARALTIAVTEQNRAMSLASVQTYLNAGLEQVEWQGANPCDLCAPNEGQIVNIGDPFESGDTEPPVHPNCRCALLPVIDGQVDDSSLGADYLDGMPEVDTSSLDANASLDPALTLAPLDIDPNTGKPYATSWEVARIPAISEMENFQYNLGFRADLLPQSRVEALTEYQGSGFENINKVLRGIQDENMSPGRIENLQKLGDRIERLIDKAPELQKDLVTYRGYFKEYGDMVRSLKVGQSYEDQSFHSTSLSHQVASGYYFTGTGGLTIEVLNPAGTEGVMVNTLTGGNEHEWLLQRGTKFEIISNKIDETGTQRIRVKAVQ